MSRMRRKVNFKVQLVTDSKFSFSLTGCRNKAKELWSIIYPKLVGEYIDSYLSREY